MAAKQADRYGKTKTCCRKRADYRDPRHGTDARHQPSLCRSAFAHVVVMMNAGLNTTLPEEQSDGKASTTRPRPRRPARPSAARRAVEEEVPVPRTAPPPAPRKADPLAALDEPDGPQWLRNLETLLANAQASAGGRGHRRPRLGRQRRIQGACRNPQSHLRAAGQRAYKRFAEPEDPGFGDRRR